MPDTPTPAGPRGGPYPGRAELDAANMRFRRALSRLHREGARHDPKLLPRLAAIVGEATEHLLRLAGDAEGAENTSERHRKAIKAEQDKARRILGKAARETRAPPSSWPAWKASAGTTVTTRPEVPSGARHLVRPDGTVLVPASVAGEVLRALMRDLTTRVRTDGGEISPAVRTLLYALHTADEKHHQPHSSDLGTPVTRPATVELTAQQVAGLLECSPEYVRRLARSGRLRARRAGLVWLIDLASLEAYRTGDDACTSSTSPR